MYNAYPYGNQSGQSGNTLSSPEKGFPDYPLVRRVENTSPEPFLHLLFFRCMVARLPLVRNWPWTSPGSPEPVRVVRNQSGEDVDQQSGDQSGKPGLCNSHSESCYGKQQYFWFTSPDSPGTVGVVRNPVSRLVTSPEPDFSRLVCRKGMLSALLPL